MPAPLPPGPPGRWITGHLADFSRDRLGFFTRCAREYGDVTGIRLGRRRVFLVTHPDLIEQVLVTHSKDFIKHFALRLNPLVLGNGLLTSESDFWLRQRRLIQPAFQRARIAAYAGDMTNAALAVLNDWRAGATCDIQTEMMRITLKIAAKTLFGAEIGGESREISEAMAYLQERFLKRFNSMFWLPNWLPTPGNLRMRRAVRRLDAIVYKFIAQRRQSPSPPTPLPQGAKGELERRDLLSILLHAQNEDDGSRMTDKQLRDEAMTLFLAGHETTALALSWTWVLLAQNPEAAANLAAEVDGVLQGRTPTDADLPQLKYAEQVVLESMRVYPPVYTVGREALREMELGGFRLPKGTTLLMPQWVVHRDPRFWEQPDQFRPERWGETKVKELPHFAYFPFGGGPRLCVGNNFALMEAVLVLTCIAQRFRFTLAPGANIEPHPTFTLRPRHGIPAVITRRFLGPGPLAETAENTRPS